MSVRSEQYLSRPGEHLVLEGYRQWSSGMITGDEAFIKKGSDIFASELGIKEGRLAYDALTTFTKTLGLCAACPLKTSPVGCYYLCRDEVLILGLIAGIQHNEETTIALCLNELTCPARCREVLTAAEVFATTLRMFHASLMPVPARTIKAILTENISTSTLQ